MIECMDENILKIEILYFIFMFSTREYLQNVLMKKI